MLMLSRIISFCLMALGAAGAHALGLGEIDLRSRLNQPLKAVVPVSDVDPAQSGELVVQVASAARYRSAGLRRDDYLRNLDFAVDTRAGETFVTISGSEPLREPFIDLLLEARLGNQIFQRNYTLLVDPPEFFAPDEREASGQYEPLQTPPESSEPSAQDGDGDPSKTRRAANEPSAPSAPVVVNAPSQGRTAEPEFFRAAEDESPPVRGAPGQPLARQSGTGDGSASRATNRPLPSTRVAKSETAAESEFFVTPDERRRSRAGSAPSRESRSQRVDVNRRGPVTTGDRQLDPELLRQILPEASPGAGRAPAARAGPDDKPPIRSRSREPVSPRERYTVRRGETLWRVAERFRPGAEVSMEQMMLAIQRANPEAFVAGDPTAIKAGARLRIPGRDEALATNSRDAERTVSGAAAGASGSRNEEGVDEGGIGSVPPETASASTPASSVLGESVPADSRGSESDAAVARDAADPAPAESVTRSGPAVAPAGPSATGTTPPGDGTPGQSPPGTASSIADSSPRVAEPPATGASAAPGVVADSPAGADPSQTESGGGLVRSGSAESQLALADSADQKGAVPVDGTSEGTSQAAGVAGEGSGDQESVRSLPGSDDSAAASDQAAGGDEQPGTVEASTRAPSTEGGLGARLREDLAGFVQTALLAAGGALLLAAGVFAVLRRRRRSDEAPGGSLGAEADRGSEEDQEAVRAAVAARMQALSESGGEAREASDVSAHGERETEAATTSSEAVPTATQSPQQEEITERVGATEDEDAFATDHIIELSADEEFDGEAEDFSAGDAGGDDAPHAELFADVDFRVSYGMHDDAVSRLEEAIAHDPNDSVLAVKLAEVHYAAGNREGFDQARVAALSAGASGEEVEKLESWAKSFPESSESRAGEPDDKMAGSWEQDDGNLDLDLDLDDLAPNGAGTGTPQSFSHEADPVLSGEVPSVQTSGSAAAVHEDGARVADSETEPASSSDAHPDTDDGLDFDLGDFDAPAQDPRNSISTASEETGKQGDDALLDLSLDDFDRDEAPNEAAQASSFVGEAGDASGAPHGGSTLDDVPELTLDDFSGDSDASSTLEMQSENRRSDRLDGLEEPSREEVTATEVEDFSLDDFAIEDDEAASGERLSEDLGEGEDVLATRLDLARAYVEMGDTEMARPLLDELLAQGDEGQREEARRLLNELG